jgi:hypothetical protein
MTQPEKPLLLWERSGTRRAVAFSFVFSLLLLALAFFPAVSDFYDSHPVLRNLVTALTWGLGIALACLELWHSDEANRHRAAHTRLDEQANVLRDEANEARKEANRLSNERLKLQTKIHELQRKLTEVRLFIRADKVPEGVRLKVENLSDFDLWVNQVRLVFKQDENAAPETRVIGGGNRISHGKTEEGYKLNSHLMAISANRSWRIKFLVTVVAVGLSKEPVTIESPIYSLTFVGGQPRELKTESHTVGIAGL